MPFDLNPFDDRSGRARRKGAVLFILLIAANAGAWLWALMVFADKPALLATAFLAYMFGLRHAFDADHIAAIDNVVRKLMREGKTPISTGFFFSLGHSTIVVLASLAIALAASGMQSHMESFHAVGGVIGTTVSAVFLVVIGLANLLVLKGVWAAFNRARRGEKIVDEDLDMLLAGRGLMSRLFRSLFRVVSRSWHMYPVGFLFGLGFDTATEIGLLGISASQAAEGLSVWSIMVFPALFTAGMSLMDTADSTLMTGAYGWAEMNSIRKLWYNLTITAISVVVALFIGGIEALGMIADQFDLKGRFWGDIGALNDNFGNLGFVVVGLFLVSWIASVAVYRYKGFDKLAT
ncbi:HoxN/HupN/NixA family nickel/cobalt transporter [Allorhizobium sp. BGMRC 0089]|uniref:HoxN/HupN/NixA family nickel/cobalt transporter n=1 Tax=Allorhizobium sonneratiae TaxID=2934936 RepID=UPI0020340449|nr:HoxN/HupN/NixA family nickel/cobalt transporter [Allorhizobium sonneratiae]MCM2291832.1 HoxN/HupN/NixA family nickel/cobalt transporter [Allorhizobium sonneratiae]